MADEATLHHRIEQLEQQLAELREEVGDRATGAPAERTGNRRTILKLAAASGVAALATGTQRAKAANNDPLLCGSSSNTATAATGIAVVGNERPYGIGATDNGLTELPDYLLGAAILGHCKEQAFLYGVIGYGQAGLAGVYGVGEGSVVGVQGYSQSDPGIRGTGSTGGSFAGVLGAIRFETFFNSQPPPIRSGARFAKYLEADGNNDLWWSYEDGDPARWRKLAGPLTAGALHPIEPIRVYDSRTPEPSPGAIAAGQDRLISVADGRDIGTGAVTLANAVAAGATTVAVNLTITDTTGAGFLTLAPGSATVLGASSINWGSAGFSVANALIVKLDATRQLKVFCGGAGTTQFIVDVQGYWV